MAILNIRVEPASKGELGSNTLEFWLVEPEFQQPTIKEPVTGQMVAVPDGSVAAYLKKHLSEFGGLQAYVTVTIDFKPSAEEKWSVDAFKQRLSNAITPQEFAEKVKSGKIKSHEQLSPEQLAALEKGDWKSKRK
jgi:hypothetical protein